MTACLRPDAVRTTNIDPLEWGRGDTVHLVVENADTVGLRRLGILFRFDNTFELPSIPLSIRVATPDSLWFEEPFTAVLADRVRANNDFYEAVAGYRTNVLLGRKGTYTFSIVNTGESVRGLWGAGMIIE